jgi:hypothetical protein
MSNKNMHAAKSAKNDEFYTQLTDIEKELRHYKDHFKDKVVFCNCDDPIKSEFWQYFENNFYHLGLKKLISTHYDANKPTYKQELFRNTSGKVSQGDIIITNLTQNGDFRSPEAIALLEECDIVVTNPPFSLFREFIAQLDEYGKKFLVIGSQNAITYKETFKLIKDNKLWLGHGLVKSFMQPDGTMKTFGNICWFTNLDYPKRHENLLLYKTYNPIDYPKYDNYDAINVDKVTDIPVDYDGVMGVPITFLDKWNPEQFEILDANDYRWNDKIGDLTARPFIDGKEIYRRILIKRKDED